MDRDDTQGQSAVHAALALARQNKATAALVAALVPLAAVSAHATPTQITVTPVFSTDPNNGSAEVTYDISNSTGYSISEIEIPEIHAGDLGYYMPPSQQLGTNSVIPAGHAPLLPSGWSGSQVSSATLGSSVPGASPAEFLDLSTGSAQIPGFGSGSFSFDIPTTNTIEADVAFSLPNDTTSPVIIVDPPIPNTQSTPEPGSMAVLGTALAGLIATARRRRKA